MADAQSSAAVAVRACKGCGKPIPPSPKRASMKPVKCGSCRGGHQSKEQHRISCKKYNERNREKLREGWKLRRLNPGRRAWDIEYKRRKRREKADSEGRAFVTRSSKYSNEAGYKQVIDRLTAKLVEANAHQAWRYWINIKAPDWWMRAYYRDRGKPWANPRLTDAQRWKIRYWCDPAFRAKEIEKVQVLKERRAQRIAVACDGTLTGEVIVALFAAAKDCRYCGELMRSVDKSLDHKIPLSAGGAHSITNVVVCCKTCNTLKADRTIDEWIAALIHRSTEDHCAALRVLPAAA